MSDTHGFTTATDEDNGPEAGGATCDGDSSIMSASVLAILTLTHTATQHYKQLSFISNIISDLEK